MRPLSSNRWLPPVLAAVAALVLVLRLAVSADVFSPTIDEPCHIGAAVSMVEAHKLVALVSHPPLARWVVAIPLWLDGARLPQYRGHTTVEKEDVGYALGTQILYNSPTPFRKLLTHARWAILIFPILSLLFLYLLGNWLAGAWAASLAVIFFSLDPTLLGHGMWVCTDAAACAGFLAALYCGLRWVRQPTWRGAAVAGIAIGLAISAKFSCLFVIPALAAVAVFDAASWRKLLLQSFAVAGIAFLALWAVYLFNIGPLGDQNVMGHPDQWEHLPAWIRTTPVPMPSFFLGLARLAAHNHVGHAAYLNGQVRANGWWYYFPELLVLKSPLGFLAALEMAIVLCLMNRQWRAFPARATLIPALIFLILSMAGSIDIGIRHILPLIPLLYLLAAWQLARRGWIWVLAGLILCTALETAAIHPDYLSYFNFAVGGPSNGQRFALDSNLDWNQDVYRLADWIEQNGHGRSYAIRLSGQRNAPLLRALNLDPGALQASPHGALLCISKNVRLLENRIPWLIRHEPIAHVGYSIDIYDLTSGPLPDEPDDVPPPDDPANR